MTVSVLSTCFNQERVVGDCVRSVLAQTRPVSRHVMVDDGSTDGSPAVLAGFPELTVVRVTNRGMAGARNAGLLHVESDWVVLLDGDDWLEPNFVQECLRVCGDADVVVSGMRREGVGARDVEFPRRHPSRRELWEWRETYAWSCSMFRTDLLRATGGFHPGVGDDCDWDMWVDLAARGARFAYTNETFYHYRIDAGSLTRRKRPADWDAHRREMMRHHHGEYLPGQEFA